MSELRELGLGAVFDGRPLIGNLHTTIQDAKLAFLEKLLSSDNEFAYCVVQRMVLDHHLFEGAKERGAQVFAGYKLTGAEFDEAAELWTLELQAERGAAVEIRCRVLVGADGAGSRVRRLAGLRRNGEAHTSVALRAYATAEGLPEGTLRFDWLANMISGYGWVFPLTEDKVNVGIGMRRRDLKHGAADLEACLQEYVRYLSSKGIAIRNLDGVRTHPLPLASQSPPLVPKRQMALVGDAASMIDPLLGEGIHYGIWAGRLLGRVIGEEVNRGGDLQSSLNSYAKAYAEQFGETMKQYEAVRDLVLLYKYFG